MLCAVRLALAEAVVLTLLSPCSSFSKARVVRPYLSFFSVSQTILYRRNEMLGDTLTFHFYIPSFTCQNTLQHLELSVLLILPVKQSSTLALKSSCVVGSVSRTDILQGGMNNFVNFAVNLQERSQIWMTCPTCRFTHW